MAAAKISPLQMPMVALELHLCAREATHANAGYVFWQRPYVHQHGYRRGILAWSRACAVSQGMSIANVLPSRVVMVALELLSCARRATHAHVALLVCTALYESSEYRFAASWQRSSSP